MTNLQPKSSKAAVKPYVVPGALVWMDLEMTGLDPDQNQIIEVATVITDSQLIILAEGPIIAIHQDPAVFETMDSWNREHHTKSGLWKRVVESTTTLEQAQELTLDFIKKHVKLKESPLCGNSIWQDRRFIAKHMKKLDDYLHYRLIDVSTIKTLAKLWFPTELRKIPEKESKHLAMDDIKESIEELRAYRTHFFIEPK